MSRRRSHRSFASDTIWFPLETTQLIDEPESYVVLDILTPERLGAKELPDLPTRRIAALLRNYVRGVRQFFHICTPVSILIRDYFVPLLLSYGRRFKAEDSEC